jgi:hypothetical protein
LSYKILKKEIKSLLKENSAEYTVNILKQKNKNNDKHLNPLISLLYDPDEVIKHKAAEAIGILNSEKYEHDTEKARILMRRLMWSLNEESGGIGWGAVEAMAETAVHNKTLFDEFYKIIISYIDPDSGSFLDHKELHPGIVWAIGRLLKAYPETGTYAEYVLKDLINDDDPRIRGHALWSVLNGKVKNLDSSIKKHLNDNEEFFLYDGKTMKKTKISEIAQRILN